MSQHLLKNNRHTLQDPGFQEVEVHHDLRNLQKNNNKNVWHDIEAKHILSWPKTFKVHFS